VADRDRRHHDLARCPAFTTTKPGSATFPLPGVGAEVVDDDGHPVSGGGGYLTLTEPWPAMLRGIWGDPERYRDTYWSASRAGTSPATAPSSTTTATSGCSAGSTT
jgi:acyl-coenzyme A synthetase/AMP-(fatty) acid ligase